MLHESRRGLGLAGGLRRKVTRSHAKRRERAEKYIFGVMTILYLKKSVISAFVIQKAPVLQTPG